MNILGRKETTTVEPQEISGQEAIRQRLLSRMRKGHLAGTCTDLSLPLPQVEKWCRNEGALPEAMIHTLCKEVYPYHVEWDPLIDKLKDISPPATVAAPVMPPAYVNPDPDIARAQAALSAALRAATPAPVTRPPTPGSETAGKFPPRPGFAHD